MTIWDLFLPWRTAKARDVAETALAHARNHGGKSDKRVRQLETELQQTKRTGYDDLAKDLGCSVKDIMDGKIEPLLHDDPQAVYRALDNAQASEIKFRLVKRVNLELRLVIRNLIDGLCLTDLTEDTRMFLRGAEPYATPLVMGDKRKVLGSKRKTLSLNYPEGERDDGFTQAQAEEITKSAAK